MTSLIILSTLIAFVFSAPVNDSKSHGTVAGNAINSALHLPQNTCNQQVKIIGGNNVVFDNGCKNTAVEVDTNEHSNSGNASGSDGK
ncbi:hypothetical protein CONCODRAFT_12328 [Conidiobolus coronatus NRRL 28638]|uniref:Chaplin domain-containing protein n=1 Tax=Conidiobolus coronatus (strain ATCC 28846 / CBS 209.66 / NRRL 28638) TaxID=796925 RepID=A0A137NT97_CONC2|nr:hypothetical protein CONCODRAFT_12328 [Conidiobolus coronatus NRRL 28638]|eukprot:KXN65942.1 hypothetical protein CONCODRAFT_12328 [Conidiobolus coronatus NRRL 28638]